MRLKEGRKVPAGKIKTGSLFIHDSKLCYSCFKLAASVPYIKVGGNSQGGYLNRDIEVIEVELIMDEQQPPKYVELGKHRLELRGEKYCNMDFLWDVGFQWKNGKLFSVNLYHNELDDIELIPVKN